MTIDIHDGHEHDDSYSVSPAAMSDEQIARRDAMSIVELAEHVAQQSVSLNVQLEQVYRAVLALEQQRDEMRSVLREITEIFPRPMTFAVIERAEKLLGEA